jgi:protocatechuate 3,4-dioxygenase beta subunit
MKKAIFALAAMVVAGAVVATTAGNAKSGLNVGEMVTPFHPTHVSGPDKGTDTCPPCKYGARPAVQVWSNHDSEENSAKLAAFLSEEVEELEDAGFKGFMIMLTNCDKCVDKSKALGATAEKKGWKNIGVAHLAIDTDYVKNYKVNTSADVKNTVFVYKNRKVVAKFVNLKADKAGLAKLDQAIHAVTVD